MSKISFKKIAILIPLLFGMNCGGGDVGTGVSNPPSVTTASRATETATATAAAAAGAFFGGEQSSSLSLSKETLLALMDLFIKKALAQEACLNDPGCTCEVAVNGSSKAPKILKFKGFNSAGTYGSTNSPMTVTGKDFCTLPAGMSNPSSGPDGQGRFGGFSFISDAAGSCMVGDGSVFNISMTSASSGIWRNTEDSAGNLVHQPEIYGSFSFAFNGSQINLDCTIWINPNGTLVSANCTDADGKPVTQETTATCNFSVN